MSETHDAVQIISTTAHGPRSREHEAILEYAARELGEGRSLFRVTVIAKSVLRVATNDAIRFCRQLVERGDLLQRLQDKRAFRLPGTCEVSADGADRSAAQGAAAAQSRQRRCEQGAQVLDFARAERAAGRAYVRVHQVRTLLECSQSHASNLMQDLVADGHFVRGATNPQGMRLAESMEHDAPEVYLDALLHRARLLTSSTAAPKPGRRAAGTVSNLTELSPAQLDAVERLCDLMVEKHPKVERQLADGVLARGLAAADARFCVWVAGAIRTAHGEQAGWALHGPVQRWVEEQHAAKYQDRQAEARRRRDRGLSHDKAVLEAAWEPAMAVASVEKARAAVNTLLNLAATHVSTEHPALIDPSPRIRPSDDVSSYGSSNTPRHHESWTPIITRWGRRLKRRSEEAGGTHSQYRLHAGLTTIAEAATRVVEAAHAGGVAPRAAHDIRNINWIAVRQLLDQDRRDGILIRWRHKEAKYAWRMAFEMLTPHFCARADTWFDLQWETGMERRESLVPTNALDIAARPALPLERDFSDWVDRAGNPYTALIDGADYGLRQYAAWATLPSWQLAAREYALPPRTWGMARPSGQPRRASITEPNQLREASMKSYFTSISRLCGWLTKHHGTDWTEVGLEYLACDPALTIAYVTQYLSDDARVRQSPKESGMTVAKNVASFVATLANGWCYSRASQLLQSAERRVESQSGDERAAALIECDRRRAERDAFGRCYVTLFDFIGQLAEGNGMSISADNARHARRVAEISDAWRAADGVHGLMKIRWLRDAIADDVVRAGGGMTLEAQAEAIIAGRFRRTSEWAKHVQFAVILTVLTRIPLRGETIRHLRVSHLLCSGGSGCREHGSCSLRFDIPGARMKSDRPFQPGLIRPNDVGTAVHERAICRPLLRLYFMQGGALDFAQSETDAETGVSLEPKQRSVPSEQLRDLTSVGQRERARVPWLFPAMSDDADPEERHSGAWTTSRLTELLKAAIIRHASLLRVEPNVLKLIHGAMGIHVIRKLFGSYWAGERGMLAFASALLHHQNVALTAARYCARFEGHITLEVDSDDGAFGNGRPTRLSMSPDVAQGTGCDGKDERERLRAERDESLSDVARLRARVAELEELVPATPTLSAPDSTSGTHADGVITALLEAAGDCVDADELRDAMALVRMMRKRASTAAAVGASSDESTQTDRLVA